MEQQLFKGKSIKPENAGVRRRETNIAKGLEGKVYKEWLRSLGSLMMAVVPHRERRG